MKKLILCSLAVFVVTNVAWGRWEHIGLIDGHKRANEYYWSDDVENKQIECNNDLKDTSHSAGDFVVVINTHANGQAKYVGQCDLHARVNQGVTGFVTDGDMWINRGDVHPCHLDNVTCVKEYNYDSAGTGPHRLCVLRSVDTKLQNTGTGKMFYFNYGSKLTNVDSFLCKKCAKGYKIDQYKCVPNNDNPDCPEGKTRATLDISGLSICDGKACTVIKKGECYDTQFLKCMEAAKRGEPANWNTQSCNCGDRMVWDPTNYKCVSKTGPNPGLSCQQRRKTAEGQACCRTNYEWKPTNAKDKDGEGKCICPNSSDVFDIATATCKPAGGCDKYKNNPAAFDCCNASTSGASWNETTNTCDCVEGKKWNAAQKQCVQDNSNVLSNCIYRFSGKVKCANGNSMTINEQRPLTVAELGGMSCDQFNNLYQSNVGKLNEFFASYCGDGAIISIVTGPSDAEVKNAQSVLSAFFSTAQSNASVWKNAEGKFNTARLASDLTAGVVLGSVGGVVSGVVIKKNQVKKGFEALHCAVGGQKVADWGDEFNVGLR